MANRRLRSASLIAVVCSSMLAFADDAAKGELLSAVRNDDTRAVKRLLSATVDPNTRDAGGATALMLAAAFGSVDGVRALLDAGADVNASTTAGATALMWAAGDVRKIRLLLDRGAAVGAKTKDRTTALIAAARGGDIDVMRLLLARGADPRSDASDRAELLRIAHSDRPEVREVVTSLGLDLKSLGQSGLPNLAGYSVAATAAIETLLDIGADSNPRGRFPLLGAAVFQGYSSTARVLLERGANPNARGQHDVTPLMMAAGASHPDPAIVSLLIDKGADVRARDQVGRTALDWALLQGEGPVPRLLQAAGATSSPLPSVPAPVGEPRSARAALAASITRLQTISPVLYDNRKCIACHHQTLPLVAMTRANARGIAVDSEAMAHPARSIVDVWNGRRHDLMLGREVGGGANELTYGLVALAEAHVPPNTATDAAVANLLAIQRSDGSWVFLDTRPPQADNSPIPFTAMAMRGLDAYAPPALRGTVAAHLQRAREYLRAAVPGSTQDEAFKLLGLVWSRATRLEISAQAARVAALQRADGGWSQMPTMTSDAYATGEALYALALSGLPPTNRSYQRGVTYLLRTQLEDGSWFVRSRAFGFQPYFESGFPHGPDQFISASATAWAAIALAYAI